MADASVLVGSASQLPGCPRQAWLALPAGRGARGWARQPDLLPETGPGEAGSAALPAQGTSPFLCLCSAPHGPPPSDPGRLAGSRREGKRRVREHPASERPAWAGSPRPPEAQPHARLWNCPSHSGIPEAWVRPLARGFSGQLLAWRAAGGAQRRAPSAPGVTEGGPPPRGSEARSVFQAKGPCAEVGREVVACSLTVVTPFSWCMGLAGPGRGGRAL